MTQTVLLAIKKRIKRLKSFYGNLPFETEPTARSSWVAEFAERIKALWPELDRFFQGMIDDDVFAQEREPFLEFVERQVRAEGKDYITVIKSLPEESSETGTRWLKKNRGPRCRGRQRNG